jgi:hypothetical protein
VRLVYASGNPIVYKDDPGSCPCCNDDEPVGAICYPDGTCAEGTATEAANTGGDYQGDGTTCAGTDCDGAICPDGGGACYQGTLAEATAAGDHYFGYGVACVDVDCDCDSCGHYVGKELVVDLTKVVRGWQRTNPNINDCQGAPCLVETETWQGTIALVSVLILGDRYCYFSGNVTYTYDFEDNCDGNSTSSSGSSSVAFTVGIVPPTDTFAWEYNLSCPDLDEVDFFIEGPSLTLGGGIGEEDVQWGADWINQTIEPITCNCGELAGSVTANCNQITLTRAAPCQPGYCEEFESPDALGSSSTEITGSFTVVS